MTSAHDVLLWPSGAIWPPDWSQFIPDSIGAILTGAIIAIALWRLERFVARRSAQERAEASWSSLRMPLLRTMPYGSLDRTTDRQGAAKQYSEQWQRFLKLLDTRVALWAKDAPTNRELQLAAALLRELPELEQRSYDLYGYVSMALGDLGYPDHSSDSAVQDYMVHEFIGDLEHRADSREPKSAWKSPWVSHLEEVRDYGGIDMSLYRKLQRRVEDEWSELRDLLEPRTWERANAKRAKPG